MRLLVLVVCWPLLARADEVSDWVHARVGEQRAALQAGAVKPKPVDTSKQQWKARPATEAITGFTPPTSLAPLARAVRPGVVNLSATHVGPGKSLGSGFLINAEGLVVTNNHVIEKAQEIHVHLSDGRELEGTVVGRDPSTDLALLRLSGDGVGSLPFVFLGDSDQLEVGDWVVAIGNPFGLETSVTHGLISARERVIGVGTFDDFIQTNALINPGNSGGPLFNMRGEVVGVTTAIISQGQGIGFAVPINLVKDLLPNLLVNGRLERGWLGLNIHQVGEGSTQSAIVVDVFKNSPASKAGVLPGDQVVSVAGRPVDSYTQLLRRIALLAPGTSVKLGLKRAGKPLEVSATLVARPNSDPALQGTGRVDLLGLTLREISPAVSRQLGVPLGLLIEAVTQGGPASVAGIETSDVITEINRMPVAQVADLPAAMAKSAPGETVLLRVHRGMSSRYVALKPD